MVRRRRRALNLAIIFTLLISSLFAASLPAAASSSAQPRPVPASAEGSKPASVSVAQLTAILASARLKGTPSPLKAGPKADPPCCYYTGQIWNEAGTGANGVRCLDADLNTIGQNGTKVQLWTCNGSLQQQWNYNQAWELRNGLSNRCLDADLNTIGRNGGVVQLWDCNGSPQQRWVPRYGGGGATNRVSFYDNADQMCLDADTNTMGRNGTIVQRWSCNNLGQQQWYGIGWP